MRRVKFVYKHNATDGNFVDNLKVKMDTFIKNSCFKIRFFVI